MLNRSIVNPGTDVIPEANLADRFHALQFTSDWVLQTKLQGVNEVHSGAWKCAYLVGHRYIDEGDVLVPAKALGVNMPCAAEMTQASLMQAGNGGSVGTYSIMASGAERCSFAAVVFRLAQALAHFSLRGVLESAEIYAGAEPGTIGVRGLADNPHIGQGTNLIVDFTNVQGDMSRAYWMIVYAARATGSNVKLISVPMRDASHIELPTINGLLCARAVAQALSLLAVEHEKSGAAGLFCVAYLAGLHDVMTVVGHTTEGAWLRDVWRAGWFPKSFGVLSAQVHSRAHPTFLLTSGGFNDFRSKVFDHVLASAGCAAIADPCLVGTPTGPLPTIVPGMTLEPGVEIDEAASARLKASIAVTFNIFARNYLVELCRAIAVDASQSQSGELVLAHKFGAFDFVRSRHCASGFGPYYWVDPCCVVRWKTNAVATKLYGAFWGDESLLVSRLFEDDDYVELNSLKNGSFLTIGSPNFRKSRLLNWALHADRDGLALMVPVGVDVAEVLNCNLATDDLDAGLGTVSFGRCVWGVGHSGTVAPHCFCNPSGVFKLHVKHYDAAGNVQRHLPSWPNRDAGLVMNEPVFRGSVVIGMPNAAVQVRRYTQAYRELLNAKLDEFGLVECDPIIVRSGTRGLLAAVRAMRGLVVRGVRKPPDIVEVVVPPVSGVELEPAVVAGNDSVALNAPMGRSQGGNVGLPVKAIEINARPVVPGPGVGVAAPVVAAAADAGGDG